LDSFDAEETYKILKKKNENINLYINKLKEIKENIIIYFKESYQTKIQQLIETIKGNQNKKIKEYKEGKIERNKAKDTSEDTFSDLEKKSIKIKEVKKFLLFNVIYDMNSGKDEDYNFNYAYEKAYEIGNLLKDYASKNKSILELYKEYLEIFDKIKEKLSNRSNSEEAQTFINDLISRYNINNESTIDELTILFNSKKYELDINSMIFFFQYFERNNDSWNKKLSPEKYENLSSKDFSVIKDNLLELQKNGMYDYKQYQSYIDLFTCLYEKKEAIEFLFSKECEDIEKLKDRIQPTDRTITIKDINDTKACIQEIIRMKKLTDNEKIFKDIATMSKTTIEQFKNYSKIYESVIELDRNDEDSDNLYKKVYEIIKNASFYISQDKEKFLYRDEDKDKETDLENLIHLKNKIHIKNETKKNDENKLKKGNLESKDEKEIQIKNSIEDNLDFKRKILSFYKNIISDLEIIMEYMEVLRNKGSSLPIRINMEIKVEKDKPSIIYYLEDNKISFQSIRNFLFDAKTSYIAQLEKMYKEKINLTLLYGKQFRSIMKHLEDSENVDSFLRYILNYKDNKPIKEGEIGISRNAQNYIEQYELYNLNSLDNISDYITTLFQQNGKDIDQHYQQMRIISKEDCKGIYVQECEDYSLEKFIINLFWDKINQLPIAQNVLITNKETSNEEIQAFFHRSILCNYNTLFVVEINDSFSDYQQSIMNNYIDNLLSFKNQRYNERYNLKVDKKDTKIYLDSCIVFVYDKKNKNITSFIKELEKLDIQKFMEYIKDDKINQISFKEQKSKKNYYLN